MSSRPALPTAEEIGALVSIGRIAKETPYSADFLRQLARSGKLRAYKWRRLVRTAVESNKSLMGKALRFLHLGD